MTDLSFSVRPIELADALYNAVELAGDHGGKPGCPHVLVAYQSDPETLLGVVAVYGVSRLVAGRTTILLDTKGPEGETASVAIGREYADQVQSALRDYGRAKSTRVGVRLSEEGFDTVEFNEDGEPVVRTVNFSVQKEGEEPLAELAESDPDDEFIDHFGMVDDGVAAGPLTGPTAFIFEAVKRVTRLKGLEATTMDLAQTAREHVVAIAAGRHFRGILGEIDREVYAAAESRAGHLLESGTTSD